MNEKRGQNRSPVKAQVAISHKDHGEFKAFTRDLSDGGAFIESGHLTTVLDIGDNVDIQAQGFPVPMPVVKAVVVRKDKEGIACKFIV